MSLAVPVKIGINRGLNEMINFKYKYRILRKKGIKPAAAMLQAREMEAAGKWPLPREIIAFNPEWSAAGYKLRFVENPAAGLRIAGTAGSLAGLRYSGWYADSFQDSLYIGHVYQLPAKKGKPRYLAGYMESDNGGHVIDFNSIFEDERAAVYHADNLAEIMADRARVCDEHYHAGGRAADLQNTIKEARKESRELIAAIKAAGNFESAICKALKGSVKGLIFDYKEAKKELFNLLTEWRSEEEREAFKSGLIDNGGRYHEIV